MRPVLTFAAAMLLSCQTFCQTAVSGSIYSNTTWTKAGSPYTISGNLVIFDVATLTIDPGVTVLMDSASSIELRGNMVAKGTKNDTITFTGTQPKMNWWKGIKAMYSSAAAGPQITVERCHFAYAYKLFDLDYAYRGPYNFKYCTFYKNSEVSYDEAIGDTYVDYCLFLENNLGFYGGGDMSKIYVTNSWFVNNSEGMRGGNVDRCVFVGNTKYGAFMYQSITNSYFYNNKIGISADHHHDTKIQFNEIYDNEIGIEILRMWQDGNIKLRDNKICNNSDWNILYRYNNSVDISGNCFCTMDSSAIRTKIRDGYVDNAFGLLNFNKWNNCTLTTPAPLEVKKIAKANTLKVYPNPASDQLNLESSDGSDGHVMVTDFSGKLIHRAATMGGKLSMDIHHWTAGIYMVMYQNDNNMELIKVVKN
jgi:hypothetical protein